MPRDDVPQNPGLLNAETVRVARSGGPTPVAGVIGAGDAAEKIIPTVQLALNHARPTIRQQAGWASRQLLDATWSLILSLIVPFLVRVAIAILIDWLLSKQQTLADDGMMPAEAVKALRGQPAPEVDDDVRPTGTPLGSSK